ncbi:MAG: adenylate/guanylate cyclase domain-containing protein [Syntrophales bacterium]|nr:adenylate/guanylate cyclase domain-containing protein [Syntrophales bacterium]MDD5641025.1 adenylate/guanylate cyclase domain-containing protein [Syntrophales bacterium]
MIRRDESRDKPKAPGYILVVDDNRMNRLMLARGLEKQGHRVAFAEHGRQALEMLAEEDFDLVLLDIEMPEMNGYQVLERLAADVRWRELPVIMISAVEEIDSVVRCIEMGAEDYLNKPFNPVLLKARVDASLEKKRLRDEQRALFRKFASDEVADELLNSGFSLGGRLVEATVLFSDIRSFTTIAESQLPQDTIELLNDYFSLMFEVIANEGGIVNQMIGDGLMCIFGAPLPLEDHRQRAVRAALQMMELIRGFNEEQVRLNRVQIRIGIGIASGVMVAGYVGTQQRATYTCVGDTVNLAARLEAHTKVVGEPILIEENTCQGLGRQIEVVPQGEVRLKGKTKAVKVFSVPVEKAG